MVGEDENQDLQGREDELAERYAAEDGGTGQLADYDDESYGYDYNDSNELTDVDSQPGYDDSSAFNEFGGNADFDMFDRNSEDEDDEENFDGDDSDDGEFDNDEDDDKDSQIGDMSRFSDPRDNDDDDEDDNDNDDEENGEDDEDDEDDPNEKKVNTQKKVANEVDPEQLAKFMGVKRVWKEGEPVTVEILSTHWPVFQKDLNEVRTLMNQADVIVEQAISSTGPNLMLKLNSFVTRLGDSSASTISCLLKLIARPGLTLAYGGASVIEAIFDQQWSQVALIFGLKAELEAALKDSNMQALLKKIFSKALNIYKKRLKAKLKNT